MPQRRVSMGRDWGEGGAYQHTMGYIRVSLDANPKMVKIMNGIESSNGVAPNIVFQRSGKKSLIIQSPPASAAKLPLFLTIENIDNCPLSNVN